MSPSDRIASVLESKSRRLWSVSPAATVLEAIQIMSEADIGALPVISSSGRLMGLLSERDYARKVVLAGRMSRDTAVHEIMSTPVVTADPQDTVERCMHLMTENRVRHLPVVVNDDQMIGIISIGDLVNWIISAHEQSIEQLRSYIAGAYPG